MEIVFTSQIACCIAGSSVPENTPVYEQTAETFENQNNLAATTVAANDITADATNIATKMQRRVNIQKYTANFTTGDTGVASAGNSDAAYATFANAAEINAENSVYYISNIILHIEALQFKNSDIIKL